MRAFAWVVVCCAASAVGQRPDSAAPAAVPAPAEPVVAILGASVSAGFSDQLVTPETPDDRAHNATLALRDVLPVLWAQPIQVRDLSNLLLFQSPRRVGARQVERAAAADPDLVVAIDFLFWFGYSVRGGDHAARLALQEDGLALLDRLEAPLLVGDYPEMRDVDPRMMAPRMVPAAATLEALNDRLRRWAAERPRVRVFSLAGLVGELRGEARTVSVDGKEVRLGPRDLLQTDRLHATRLGVAVIADSLCRALRGHDGLPAGLRPAERSLGGLIERLDLADLALAAGEAVATPAAVGASGTDRGDDGRRWRP